ncbi:MAG: hypothetical protein A4E44_00746 [Methanosaeta sp. PtaB.Bin018]|nr:MAG: hypothetical protein A4E44_00746 [Methanosaeta sp. PtaB.Bin018]OPY48178.1 MAG: hypothetical protein A4E46_00050 [Methanosaeta sp. PtaU1.Bin016]
MNSISDGYYAFDGILQPNILALSFAMNPPSHLR